MFKPGQSGNPLGRPKGILLRSTNFRKQIEEHLPAIIAKDIALALGGDATAMRLVIDKSLPSLKATNSLPPVRRERNPGSIGSKRGCCLCRINT